MPDTFQYIYQGTPFVRVDDQEEPLQIAPGAEVLKTESGIKVGGIDLVAAKTFQFPMPDASVVSYVEGALEVHHGNDVYTGLDCPITHLKVEGTKVSIDGNKIQMETRLGRHLQIIKLEKAHGTKRKHSEM